MEALPNDPIQIKDDTVSNEYGRIRNALNSTQATHLMCKLEANSATKTKFSTEIVTKYQNIFASKEIDSLILSCNGSNPFFEALQDLVVKKLFLKLVNSLERDELPDRLNDVINNSKEIRIILLKSFDFGLAMTSRKFKTLMLRERITEVDIALSDTRMPSLPLKKGFTALMTNSSMTVRISGVDKYLLEILSNVSHFNGKIIIDVKHIRYRSLRSTNIFLLNTSIKELAFRHDILLSQHFYDDVIAFSSFFVKNSSWILLARSVKTFVQARKQREIRAGSYSLPWKADEIFWTRALNFS